MGLRVFHTADWHLGHSLHGFSRDYEHGRFLDWLLEVLEERQADVLLIAGDLFDSANPPASAQAMLYGFVVAAGRRLPGLQILAIAGNHDSAARLEAPSPVLDALRVYVVGKPARFPDGRLDTQRLVVPLKDRSGKIAAWCAAVPFLRPSDLRVNPTDDEDPLIAGVASIYREVLSAAEAQRERDQALIAMGHCYMTGTRLSELSERKVLGGNQHALPAALFPEQVGYVALGHLHLAQAVGGQEHIRYSGSPIPLALDERRYPHQVVELELEGRELVSCESLRVPRSVDILRFSDTGAGDVEAVEAALAAHRFDPDLPAERHPYLEVAVRLECPDPDLRRRIEAALEGKPARLLKLATEYPGTPTGLGNDVPARRLEELKPDGVFRERYRQQFAREPPEPLMAAFHDLMEEVQGKEA
jgi:exonuclease SbcD